MDGPSNLLDEVNELFLYLDQNRFRILTTKTLHSVKSTQAVNNLASDPIIPGSAKIAVSTAPGTDGHSN